MKVNIFVTIILSLFAAGKSQTSDIAIACDEHKVYSELNMNPFTFPSDKIIKLTLLDTHGDGWDGAVLSEIDNANEPTGNTYTLESGFIGYEYFPRTSPTLNRRFQFTSSGRYPNEVSIEIKCFDACSSAQSFNTDTNTCVDTCPVDLPLNDNGFCEFCETFIYQGTCVDSCPTETVEDYGNCLEECPGGKIPNADNVCTCPTGQYINNGVCVESCPQEYIIQGQTCITEDMCFDIVHNGQCLTECPTGMLIIIEPDGPLTCGSECPEGYLQAEDQGLNFCVSEDDCHGVIHNGQCLTECPTGLFTIESDTHDTPNTCGSECPKEYLQVENQNVCVPTCSWGKKYEGMCIRSCNTGEVIFEGACVSVCPQGYETRHDDYGCTKLLEPQCGEERNGNDVYSDVFTIPPNKIIKLALISRLENGWGDGVNLIEVDDTDNPINSFTLESGSVKYEYFGASYHRRRFQFSDDGGSSENVKIFCFDMCSSTQSFDTVTETCVDTCPVDRPLNDNGVCVDLCPEGKTANADNVCTCPSGQFLNDGVCVSVCPAGFTENADNVCTCSNGQFLNEDVCVDSCPLGKSPNADSICQCEHGLNTINRLSYTDNNGACQIITIANMRNIQGVLNGMDECPL